MTSTTDTGIAYDLVTVHGDDTPVVLVHAGVADRRMWQPQWEALTVAHDALRLDLRGFGDSTERPTGPLDHVGDLLATLDATGIRHAHLVGASMGAGVVLEAALERPGLAASVLLCPPGGSLLVEATPDLRAFFEAESAALAAGDLDAAVAANVGTWLVGPGRTPDAVAAEHVSLVSAMQRRAFEIALGWGDVDGVEPDPGPQDRLAELAATGVPVTVVVGGHDLGTTQDAARRLLAGLPDARLVELPDAAHLPSLEHPDTVTRLVLDAVGAVGGAGS